MAHTSSAVECFGEGGACSKQREWQFFTFKNGGKKARYEYIDFGQDCWVIREHRVKNMEDSIFTRT